MTSKRDRVRAAIAGEVADRPPVALWRHFPVDDQTPAGLTDAVLAFQREFDFDFVKVTPASSYCLLDWGAVDAWHGSTEGTRTYLSRRIRHVDDWESLEPLDPTQGSLGEHLRALRLIVQAESSHTPILATIFSPLAQAKNLAGERTLFDHLAAEPERVRRGLEMIAGSTLALVDAVRATGVDGIFYAVQFASAPYFDRDGYARIGLPLDRQILEQAGDLWMNLVHLHGTDVFFDLAAELPASILNWHDKETPPAIGEGRRRSGRAVCGGLSREATLVLGTPEAVVGEAREAFQATGGGRGLILGTGCVVPIHAPRGNLLAARSVVESARKAG